MMRWIAGALVATLPLAATAQPFELWETSGDWSVFTNAARQGCMIERTDAEGRQLQIGVDAVAGRDFVALFVPQTGEAPPPETRPIVIEIDGDLFYGEAETGAKDGYQGGYVFFDNPKFAADLAQKQTLSYALADGNPGQVDLTGTHDAIQAMLRCQAQAFD